MREKTKRLTAALLAAAVLCLLYPVDAGAVSFTDVPRDAWYASAVTELVERGLLSGTSPTKFSPNESLTRAAFVALLGRAVLTNDDLAQYDFTGEFSDVPQKHWANRYVNWAAEVGIVSGYGNGIFRPDAPVTRQEMAALVVRFSRVTVRNMEQEREPVAFTDEEDIAEFAKESVALCQQAGILSGYKDGSFKPLGFATRAEAAVLYSGLLKKCVSGDYYTVLRKRVLNTPVRAVIFSPASLTANLAVGHDVANGGESPQSFIERLQPKIAVNAAFFEMSTYQSWGTLVKEGRVITVSDEYAPVKPALTLDSDGVFSIQSFSTLHTASLHKEDGTESVLEHISVNRWPSSDTDATRILYTSDWGTSLGFTAKDAVTVAPDGTILRVDHDTDVPIPETGYVLAQRARREDEGEFFDSCAVGGTVRIERLLDGASTQDIVLSVGAGPRLVQDGVIYGDLSTYEAEGFRDPNITTYSARRVCVGIFPDGRLVILSAYTTLAHLSEILVSLGCKEGINLDGGGSANIYVNGQWIMGPQDRRLNSLLYFK